MHMGNGLTKFFLHSTEPNGTVRLRNHEEKASKKFELGHKARCSLQHEVLQHLRLREKAIGLRNVTKYKHILPRYEDAIENHRRVIFVKATRQGIIKRMSPTRRQFV